MDLDTFKAQAKQKGLNDDQINAYLKSKGIDDSQPQQSQQGQSPDNWSSFIDTARQIAKQEDFPVSVLLGQAALESGRGQSGLTTQDNNFFGIKGSGTNGSSNYPTQEADQSGNYYTTNSDFASYKSPEDSVRAYISLIKNNYPDAYAQKDNPMAMLQEIKNGGYATDPTYVTQVAQTPEFQQFLSQ